MRAKKEKRESICWKKDLAIDDHLTFDDDNDDDDYNVR